MNQQTIVGAEELMRQQEFTARVRSLDVYKRQL